MSQNRRLVNLHTNVFSKVLKNVGLVFTYVEFFSERLFTASGLHVTAEFIIFFFLTA